MPVEQRFLCCCSLHRFCVPPRSRFGLGQHNRLSTSRNVLLGDAHVFADIGDSAWRLDSGFGGARLWWQRPGVWRAASFGLRLLFLDSISRTLLFWAAFILTRPLGAVVGDGTNAEIIRQGYGHAMTRYPFSRKEEFRRLEREVCEKGRALWASK